MLMARTLEEIDNPPPSSIEEPDSQAANSILRLSLVLKGTARAELLALSKYFDKDKTDTIRKALNTIYWMEMQASRGAILFVRKPDGTEQELVMLP